MSSELAGRWHADLALAALGCGAVVTVVAALLRQLRWAPAAAAVAGAAVMAIEVTRSWWWALAVGLAALSSVPRLHSHRLLLRTVTVVVVVAGVRPYGATATLTAAIGAAVMLAIGDRPFRDLPVPAGAVLVLGSAASVWLCAPDTEEILVAGCVLVVPTLVSGRLMVDPVRRTTAWPAPLVLVVWAATIGFRGRPAGLPALWVALAALGGWGLATALMSLVGRSRTRSVSALCGFAAVAVSLGAAAVSARTFGLEWDLSATLLPGAAITTVVLGAWLGLAWMTARPQQRRRCDPARPGIW